MFTNMQGFDVIFYIFILVLSVVAHEISHGYMAQYLGDPTARLAGRLTWNPLKHLDPMGSFVIPLSLYLLTSGGFVIGWAKPVPYNPYNLRDQRWGDTKVALAGPITNIAIALIFGFAIRVLGEFFSGPVLSIMHTIVFVNVLLAIFNLIPIPPLDGSKVLVNALPFRQRYIVDYLERYSLFFIILFVLVLWQFFLPLVEFVFNLIVGG